MGLMFASATAAMEEEKLLLLLLLLWAMERNITRDERTNW